jgi:branched-subunit amino acid ABC-type transport system permease component
VILLVCCIIAVGAYTLVSWISADGLPLFTDWHYWIGLPIALIVAALAAWALEMLL